MAYRFAAIGRYLRGWMNYFGISQYYRPIPPLDQARDELEARDLWLKAQGYA